MRTLVVVSGPAASGKSTLAVPLAERLGLALLAKDVVKEALCERPIQVHCTAPEAKREQRFEDRDRHPGHDDDTYPDRQDQEEPLDLGGPTLVVDTSQDPDLDAVVAWVRNEIR